MAAEKGLYPRSAGRKRDAAPLTAAAATPGNMVYVADGQVVDSRSQAPWRLSSIVQFFWGIVEFIAFFFRTLFNPSGTKFKGTGNQSSWGRPDDGRGPPGVPRRRMGRINHGGGPAPPPMSGG